MPQGRPPNYHQAWTPDDLRRLKHLFGEGLPVREIAKRMGRSQASVSGRATIEKLSRKAQPPSSS